MSPSRDNPLTRFSAFTWGIGTFLLFAIGLGVLYWMNSGEPTTLEDAAASDRYKTKAEVFAAQDAALAYKEVEAGKKVQVPPHDAFDFVGKQLAASKSAAVKDNAQAFPGGEVAKRLASGETAPGVAKIDLAAIEKMSPPAGTPIDPAVLAAGKAQYILCAACHGQNGEGGPAGPAHAGSEWVTGPVTNLIGIQLRGLTGPIHVKGQLYSTIPMMVAQATQTDEQIASVLTYVRNSFGNTGTIVTPAQVKAMRGEVGKPALTEADLIKP